MKKSLFIISLAAFLLLVCSAAAMAADSYYTRTNPVQYTLVQRTTLTNDGNAVASGVVLHLPLMDTVMPAYQDFIGEQLAPYPDKILYDKNGNNGSRDAVYNIGSLKPGQSVTVEQRYSIICYSIEYQFAAASVSGQYDERPSAIYSQPSLYVESDQPEIIAFAEKALAGGTNPYQLAKNLFSQVNLYMTYKDSSNANKGALNAVRTAEGVCEDYNDLYVASLRSQKIPARQMTGYLYIPDDTTQKKYVQADGGVDLTKIGHTWAEFYLPQLSWVMADTTFTYKVNINGSDQKFVDWTFFANIPSKRHYIFFREGSASQPLSYYESTGGDLNDSYSALLYPGSKYSPFNDVSGHWAEAAINYLYDQNLAQGIGNGLYGVNVPITRAQLAVFLQRVKNPPKATASFSDVQATHWAAAAIAAAKQEGWLIGFSDGTFRPNQELTRAELATVLVRAFALKPGNKQVAFTDLDDYAWAANNITILASNGLASGDGSGKYLPGKSVSRAEFAVFFANILQLYN